MLTRRRETDLSQRDQIVFMYAITLRLSFYLLVLTAYSRLGNYILWPSSLYYCTTCVTHVCIVASFVRCRMHYIALVCSALPLFAWEVGFAGSASVCGHVV
jgi:hypothetical protein